ncbi:Pc16g03560 [Penicillium rubens Wisconsin 54-1255]|uniref:Pc16g03560 protein n=1 Tax=Penicillium rubens (strain ATCC 28089 / DSM 1075 / NRRL 1951 / Wisconsin 54-1255) TaxID=500485 RepID=B6H7S2_PENRW|nr:Pc16g03560 [Penicillium rubens Wisconsin 54-1255]
MDSKEARTFSPHDNALGATSNETPASSVQSWFDRHPNTLESNVSSALSSNPSQPLTESLASQPPIEKIAIPRGPDRRIWKSNRRVSRACDICREQKVKCSGDRPACRRCHEGDITCIYTDGKREEEARQSAQLMSQVRVYEDLLRSLHPLLDRQLAIQIEKVVSTPSTTPKTTPDTQQVQRNPIQPTDHTIEDFNRSENTQAAGLLGRPSEVAWLSRLHCEMDQHMKPEYPLGRSEQTPLLSTNYFLDDLQNPMAYPNEFLEWPSEEAASQLVDSYFHIVHASFPFVGKLYFLKQFRIFYANPRKQPGWAWMAVFNLVLAIATRHSSLMRKEPEAGTGTHMSYFTRAWQLCMRNYAMFDHPNLQQVQVESLMSLYMLSIGHVNRAWRMCGVAMRSAVAMGIHLRSESESISYISKETRYRLWWALYSLDIQLCSMTGRPPNMSLEYCTAFLPAPHREEDFHEDHVSRFIADDHTRRALFSSFISRAFKLDGQGNNLHAEPLHHSAISEEDDVPRIASVASTAKPNASVYFLYRLSLTCIGRAALDEIHSPSTASLSWDELESTIAKNNASADDWLAELPHIYHFEKPSPNCPFVRQRTSLAFQFYSIKLIILEPCLRRAIRVSFDGPCSKHCQSMATLCMQVAGSVINLLCDKVDVRWLYGYCPWWSIVHYIMQCSTILLVGLVGQIDLGEIQNAATVRNVKKACGWLFEMSKTDDYSKRAWGIYSRLAAHHNPDLVLPSTSTS